jgi:cell wall-associated NlpC family hydrolase
MRAATATAILLASGALVAPATAAAATTGGVAPAAPEPLTAPGATGGSQYTPPPKPAQLVAGKAYAPAGAPLAVRRAIRAGNRLQDKPYLYGGGHKSFTSPAYDCSGAVSYALHGGRLLSAPLDSTSLMSWGEPGAGSWITVYANSGHAYVIIAGLRLDTSGTGGRGPRWLTVPRPAGGFTARHPAGL